MQLPICNDKTPYVLLNRFEFRNRPVKHEPNSTMLKYANIYFLSLLIISKQRQAAPKPTHSPKQQDKNEKKTIQKFVTYSLE